METDAMNRPRAPASGATATAVLLLILVLAACAPYKAWLKGQAENHATRHVAFWGEAWQSVPLAARLAPAPPALVEKIRLENRLYGFPERPEPVPPEPVFAEAVRRIGDLLPERVRSLAEQRIVGIYFVNGLGGTGYAEAILDAKGKERYAVIVLDRDVLLTRRANAWASWKENSFFRPAAGAETALELILETGEEDSVVNAIVFILLHELGHVLGMASCVHPSWNGPAEVSDAYPFTALSWRRQGSDVVGRSDPAFPRRSALKPYAFAGATLSLDEAPEIYRALQAHSDFPSAQAAVTLWEDFAESFATYLHVVRQGKPYEIRIRRPGRPEQVFPSCWREARCDAKRAFMRRWFETPVSPAPPARP
ncbi:MAG TPA: hypothetical protein PKH03_04645 [Syntrophales bacterium]|nr:hypothetical protein [Syntrophales bacterium]